MASATKQPAAKSGNDHSVRVEIFDQAYNLRGSDAEYILKLAEYVDAKMRAVAEQNMRAHFQRVLMQASFLREQKMYYSCCQFD